MAGGSSCSSGARGSRDSSYSRGSRNSTELPILKPQTNWENLFFYQKTVVLYQMTVVFCRRFLPKFGDRTVDQMVQAARSGKQNIVEGFADGVTSTEMELKLLNVARASLKELKEDYDDYLRAHGLTLWDKTHPRYDGLLKFCRAHNKVEEYEGFFEKWTDEEFANTANTLCHMVDDGDASGEEGRGLQGKRRHSRAHDRRSPGPTPDPERGNRRAQGRKRPPQGPGRQPATRTRRSEGGPPMSAVFSSGASGARSSRGSSSSRRSRVSSGSSCSSVSSFSRSSSRSRDSSFSRTARTTRISSSPNAATREEGK